MDWLKSIGEKNIIFSIVSGIGSPICTDNNTAKPMCERTFGQFARVLVDIDISQTLRHKILVERKGFTFYVELEYENVPDFCSFCKTIGHHVDYCKKWYGEDEKLAENDVTKKKKQAKESKKDFVQTKDGRQEQGKGKEVTNVEKEVIDIEEEKDKENVNNVENGQVAKEKGKGLAVSASDEFREQDKQLEAEVNEELERETNIDKATKDASSSSMQGSFVDATQAQVQDDNLSNEDGAHSGSSHLIKTPDRVMKDMEFLKTSWENLVEDVDDEVNLIADLEKEHVETSPDVDAEGFQIMLSKKQKKAQKKLIHSSRNTYATRSQVSSKPSK